MVTSGLCQWSPERPLPVRPSCVIPGNDRVAARRQVTPGPVGAAHLHEFAAPALSSRPAGCDGTFAADRGPSGSPGRQAPCGKQLSDRSQQAVGSHMRGHSQVDVRLKLAHSAVRRSGDARSEAPEMTCVARRTQATRQVDLGMPMPGSRRPWLRHGSVRLEWKLWRLTGALPGLGIRPAARAKPGRRVWCWHHAAA